VSVVCFGAFMSQLDVSIAAITFPAMRREFSAPVAAVQWVSLSYLLGLIARLPRPGTSVAIVIRPAIPGTVGRNRHGPRSSCSRS
jgi:MFS family permease